MNRRPRNLRVSTFAAVLALATAPAALAGYQQGAPAGDASPPSALPKAGANASSTGPEVETSRNPFHPHTSAMVRQSNRLKAKGLSGHVMNDGEIVLALNSAKKLLTRVENEYPAHRAKAIRQAMQEIDAAIGHINSKAAKSVATTATPAKGARPALGGNTKTATSDGAVAPKPTRPQAASDAYLKEAHHELVKLESHMTSDGNAKRLGPARDLVQKAIQELTAAEEIR
jgi:hypothetical protein